MQLLKHLLTAYLGGCSQQDTLEVYEAWQRCQLVQVTVLQLLRICEGQLMQGTACKSVITCQSCLSGPPSAGQRMSQHERTQGRAQADVRNRAHHTDTPPGAKHAQYVKGTAISILEALGFRHLMLSQSSDSICWN